MTTEVLIVDDAPFVALDLEDTVFEAGFMALRPCGSVSGALALLDRRLPDCAILDIHLADGPVFPVADRLRDAGIPIIFHSGVSDTSEVRARYPDAYFCLKPCPHKELSETLRRAISSKAQLPS
jgi:DNA-binding NtrC family response regulator